MAKSHRVLVVEDDEEITHLLELHLRDLGLEVESATDGESGLARAASGEYALVVLDIMLPRLDGLEICRRIRSRQQETPILMLTAKSEEVDKIVGLEIGADDYVTKPFSIRELIARIRALLRRADSLIRTADQGTSTPAVQFDRLIVDAVRREARVDGRRVELTSKEFDLLWTMCRHPGQAFSRRQLLEMVWGYNYEGYSHTVNSHINRLRNKIEVDSRRPEFIETVWGYGYRFALREGQN